MTPAGDDVDDALTRLERRLDALQDELAGAPHVQHAATPTPGPLASGAAGSAHPDPLEGFGVELRRLADELVAAYERVLAQERRTRELVLAADAALHPLAVRFGASTT